MRQHERGGTGEGRRGARRGGERQERVGRCGRAAASPLVWTKSVAGVVGLRRCRLWPSNAIRLRSPEGLGVRDVEEERRRAESMMRDEEGGKPPERRPSGAERPRSGSPATRRPKHSAVCREAAHTRQEECPAPAWRRLAPTPPTLNGRDRFRPSERAYMPCTELSHRLSVGRSGPRSVDLELGLLVHHFVARRRRRILVW